MVMLEVLHDIGLLVEEHTWALVFGDLDAPDGGCAAHRAAAVLGELGLEPVG